MSWSQDLLPSLCVAGTQQLVFKAGGFGVWMSLPFNPPSMDGLGALGDRTQPRGATALWMMDLSVDRNPVCPQGQGRRYCRERESQS